MATYIFTSNFANGFAPVRELFCRHITRRGRFVLVASEFDKLHEKTDKYFGIFLKFFGDIGITFDSACVVDGRMSPAEAQRAVVEADVVWLSGGMTPIEFGYFKQYGLVDVLRRFDGVMIGMSAGAINMGRYSITDEFDDGNYAAYEGVGVVDITVDPHFKADNFSPDLLRLSHEHPIYGLCDDAAIAVSDGGVEFLGEIYELKDGEMSRVVTMRRFNDADAQEVSDLVGRTLRVTNSRDYPADEIERLAAKMDAAYFVDRAARMHIYVAVDGDCIVGCGAIDREGDECGLYNIFVLPEYQGKGVGRRIVEALERDELATGARRIELHASMTAVEFYRKLGYDYKGGIKQLDGDGLYRLEKYL